MPLLDQQITEFFPDPSPEIGTIDGEVRRFYQGGSGGAWSFIRNTYGTNANNSGSTGRADTQSGSNIDAFRWINRFIMLYDTSSITFGRKIDSADIQLYVVSKASGMPITVGITNKISMKISDIVLDVQDYNISTWSDALRSSEIAVSAITVSAYNTWTILNDNIHSSIDRAGITRYGFRLKEDYEDTIPTWSDSTNGGVTVNTADQSGTSQDPKLVVTHSLLDFQNIIYLS